MAAPSGTRQVRLRSEYAPWYPTISVSIWLPALVVARKVARQLLEGEQVGTPMGCGTPRAG